MTNEAPKVQFKEIEINKLKPAPYNPRLDLQEGDAEFEKLRKSIKEFGFVEPIIFNKRSGYIIGGHQRAKVLSSLGYEKALCAIVDLSDEQEKALNIGMNKLGGDWDYTKLKDLLLEIDGLIDIELTGFDEEEMDQLMRQYFDDDNDVNEEQPFDAEAEAEAIINPISKMGDLWQLGPHRLIVGDATSQGDIFNLMGGELADCVFSDPPYNVDYEGKTKDKLKIQNDKMEQNLFLDFLLRAFRNWYNVCKAGAPFYICHADTEGLNFRQAVKAAGFDLKQVLIWVKNTIVMGRQDYHWQHEPILYGWKPGASHKYYADRTKSTVFDEEMDYKKLNKMSKKELVDLIADFKNQLQTTVIREAKPTANREHPTMKPLKLIRHYLMNSTKRGDNVLDTFGGSGSTLIACEQLKRVCFMAEYDPIYADVICKRYELFTGQKAVLINERQTDRNDEADTRHTG